MPVDRKQISRAVPAVLAMIAFLAAAVGLISDESPRDWLVNDRLFSDEIRAAALKHKLDPQLVRSVVFQESRFDPFAIGKAGEIGLMQLMPPGKPGAPEEWARVHRVKCPSRWKLFRIDTNINIGCWYLARALKKWQRYRCCTELALIEYNAGSKYADLYKPENYDGEVIPRIKIVSTKKYVSEIMANYRR